MLSLLVLFGASSALAQDAAPSASAVEANALRVKPDCLKAAAKADNSGFEATINAAVEGAVEVMLKVLFYSPVGSPGASVLLDTGNEIRWLCDNETAAIFGNLKTALSKARRVDLSDPKTVGAGELKAGFRLKQRLDFKTGTMSVELLGGGSSQGSFTIALDKDEAGYLSISPGTARSKLAKLLTNVPQGTPEVPIVVLVLIFGAIAFTLGTRFVNLTGFTHAISVIRGRYDDPDAPGEVTHSQAFSSALSATVGLGNIAGVAVAVHKGGPGAVFWMMFLAFFGMASKFVESTLAQQYRDIDEDGHVEGGAFLYLSRGLAEMGPKMGILGKGLAIVFAVFCIGGSFGGGNMFQSNQAFAALSSRLPFMADKGWLFGIIMAGLVAAVILGGIKKIGVVAERIVPTMVVVYLIGGFTVLLVHLPELPSAIGLILSSAFSGEAVAGGFLGILVIGFTRAAFSNEAGIGSSAIAHSAAKTTEPVREGMVAMMEPFLDTIIVCAMTGLVVVVTGAYATDLNGVLLTEQAFGTVISWFPWVLSFAVLLFAFSTMISWSYYGERSWEYLFGRHLKLGSKHFHDGSIMIYKVIFVFFVYVGAVGSLDTVITFSDLMILSMAFPNIIGCMLLLPKVTAALSNYKKRLAAGEMPPLR
jgi:AGCS family alanine or glycine:cation symporter